MSEQRTLFRDCRPAAPYRKGSETSRAAAAAQSPEKLAGDKQRIYSYVALCGNRGATRDEIAVGIDIPLATVCGRVADLVKAGYLVESSATRRTRTGAEAAVLVLAKWGAL